MGGNGGPIYDSMTEPSMLGSGGAGNPGGSGGGRVKLFVGHKLLLNGNVLADAVTSTNGAGGAGGAIWLKASEVAGAGAISANGGSGNNWPLAGGGGRIALEYSVKSHTGRVQASGAMTSGQSAGSGTIYERNTDTSVDKLVVGNVDNNGAPTTSGIETLLPTGTALPSVVEVKGGTLRLTSSTVLSLISLSRGTLTADADLTIAQRPSLASGKLVVKGSLLSPVTVAGGTLSIEGSYTVASASDFTLSSGTCEVLGTMTLPEFSSTNMKGGTFNNKGRLNITNNVITVPVGVTLSENGTVNATDTVETLRVDGTLTHELGQLNGLVLNVNGDATINGSIALAGKGLRGTNAAGISGPGQYYQLVNGTWTPVSIGGGITGGSHGGMGGNGGPIYDSMTEPSMLGSGGDGNPGGSGGGRVKLFVGQRLQLNGGVLADAITSTNGAGGAGGAIWLKASELAGAGAISANGGSGNYWPLAGGGGRIALEYGFKSHTGRVQAAGAVASGQSAGAGTIHVLNTSN
jgi:hypothetical protein